MKTEMLLEYDESVDAVYLTLSDAAWDHQVRLGFRIVERPRRVGVPG